MDIVDRLRDSCIGGDGCKCTLQEAADEIERLRAALVDTLCFLERHSNRWDGVNGKHPHEVVTAARDALKTPNDKLRGCANTEPTSEAREI